MTTLREAAQQALESIDWLRHHLIQHHGCLHMDPTASGIPAWLNKNEAALRAALAEPVQEPVAWLLQSELDDLLTCNHRRLGADSPRIWAPFDISSPSPDMGLVAVYAAPPQRKPLTEVELEMAYREIWRNLPTDFDHTSSGWIEQGIRYAERAHGIGGQR